MPTSEFLLTRMEQEQLLRDIISLGKMPGSKRAPIICCDRVEQESLLEFQNRFMSLIDRLAKQLGAQELVYESMPYIYTRQSDDQ